MAIAFVRGFARHSAKTLGNFWVDFTRSIVYVLLPLSIVGALLLCSQGVIQNFASLHQGRHARRRRADHSARPGGFAGSHQDARAPTAAASPTPTRRIRMRTPRRSRISSQMLLIFVIPAGLTYTFGKMVRDTRQGWALFAAMSVLFLAGVFVVYPAEQAGNPILAKLGVETPPPRRSPAATWKARKCASASPTPPCSR